MDKTMNIKNLFLIVLLCPFYCCLDECGSGINLCEITMKMPWTKCFKHNCNDTRMRYTLRCCGNMHKTECYKVCNITDEDLIIREPCAPRCVNGVLESGKCKCNNGYSGYCCDACPPANYCENGGTCSMVGPNKTCYCTKRYNGDRCQYRNPTTLPTTAKTTVSTTRTTTTTATTPGKTTTPPTTTLTTLTKPTTTTPTTIPPTETPRTTTPTPTPPTTTRSTTTPSTTTPITTKPITTTPTTTTPTTTTPTTTTPTTPTPTTTTSITTPTTTTPTTTTPTTSTPTTTTPTSPTPTTTTPITKTSITTTPITTTPTTTTPTTTTPKTTTPSTTTPTTPTPTISTPITTTPTTTTIRTTISTTASAPITTSTPTTKPTSTVTPTTTLTTTSATLFTRTTVIKIPSTSSTKPTVSIGLPITITQNMHYTKKAVSSVIIPTKFTTSSAAGVNSHTATISITSPTVIRNPTTRSTRISQTAKKNDNEICKDDPCLYGECIDQVNGYICECNILFKGKHCTKMKIWAIVCISIAALAVVVTCCFFCLSCNRNLDDNKVIPLKIKPQPYNSDYDDQQFNKKKRGPIRPRIWKY